MGFFQRLREIFVQHKKRNTAVVAGSVLGLITITTTQVVTPTPPEPPSEFPTASSVGPAVDPTITYTGDCNFGASDDGLVIDARIVDCEDDGLRFAAGAYTVTFRNSIIRGGIYTFQYTPGDAGVDDFPKAPVFIVEDSDVIQVNTLNGQDRALCCAHYTVERSYIQGKHSGAGAHNNVILRDNYVTTDGTDTHSSGMRVLKNSIIEGNTIQCKPAYEGTDGGCSAAAVFYSEALNGSSAAAFNLDIIGNYFKRGVTNVGNVPSGPYNATRFINCENRVDCVDLHFTNNQIDLGWGVDGDEFPLSYGGNTWTGNYWTDDVTATSGQVR